MLRILLLSLAAVVMGQIFLPGGRLTIDRVDGFSVEYDDAANIILLVSNRDCYIVEAPDATWDNLVRNHDQLHATALAIIRQIESNSNVTSTTFRDAAQEYRSRLEELQCLLKHIFLVHFTPTASS